MSVGERGNRMTVTDKIRRQVQRCLDDFRRGELSEASLQGVLDTIDTRGLKRHDLLYMQTSATGVTSRAHGMRLIANGEVQTLPANPDEWPYQTVLEAIRDGWRVVQFPNLALMLDNRRSYGLGNEFILERESVADEDV